MSHLEVSPVYGKFLWNNKNNKKQEEGHNMYVIYMILRRQGIHISRLQYNLDTKRERYAHGCNLNFVIFYSFEWVLKNKRIFFFSKAFVLFYRVKKKKNVYNKQIR